MKFGEITIEDAEGAVLGHTVRCGGDVLKKGRVLDGGDLGRLRAGGIDRVYAGILAVDDIDENTAALRIAQGLAGQHVIVRQSITGRVNIHAAARGLAVVDADRLNALNHVDESITVATVTPYGLLEEGELVATVKIIPFSVTGVDLGRAEDLMKGVPILGVAPLVEQSVGLVISKVDGMRASLVQKAETAVRARVEGLDSILSPVEIVEHQTEQVAAAIGRAVDVSDIVLVFGASAIVDRADVVPAALVMAGGDVVHLGMPVDPGNLLMLGRMGETVVIGVPSCARSPKLNGFDWVLARVLAGLTVTGRDLMDMGVGGLLKEIPTRPSPREGGR